MNPPPRAGSFRTTFEKPMTPNPLLGGLLHAVGAMSAAWCYTPEKRTRAWSWQTYWLAQACVAWVVMPWLGAFLTTPNLFGVLAEAPRDVMTKSFLLGMLYGIGGTAFGIGIRYVGFSITYALAIGISCVLGTLLTPLLDGQLAAVFEKVGGGWVMAGVAVATIGIFSSGLSGWLKESDHNQDATKKVGSHVGLGLFFCVLAGVLSAVFSMSLNAGAPIADLAEKAGAGQFKGNIVYIFSCGGACLTTAIYCLYLHLRHRTMGEYVSLPAGEGNPSLPINFAMAMLTGILWYGQFFFYGLGHVRMGSFGFTSWAIHMAMLVLFSTLVGLLLREWSGCRPRTRAALAVSLTVLLIAVALLTYGNYLGDTSAAH